MKQQFNAGHAALCPAYIKNIFRIALIATTLIEEGWYEI